MTKKVLDNTNSAEVKTKVPDVKFFGNPDSFKLLCKASSVKEGWQKSTKAMEISGVGCVIQVSTHQRNGDCTNSIAEAVTFVPNCRIETIPVDSDIITGRRLVSDFSSFTNLIAGEAMVGSTACDTCEECTCEKEFSLEEEFRNFINCNSLENSSNTPDFILAKYLSEIFSVTSDAINVRKEHNLLGSSRKKQKLTDFEKDLRVLIKEYDLEEVSDTPAYILARYLRNCLNAFNVTVASRRTWYGYPENKEADKE